MAWRVTGSPSVRRAIDCGPFSDRRATRRKRVSSPSAANTGTASRTAAADSLPLRDIALDVLDLLAPAFVVHLERLGTARERHLVEAGFDDGEHRPLRRLFQLKLDQRHRFARSVDGGIDVVRMPPKRQE